MSLSDLSEMTLSDQSQHVSHLLPIPFPAFRLQLHQIFLSSFLSAAFCTVLVYLWGLHTVCMCLG